MTLSYPHYIWLVVLTILNNFSQWEGLSHIIIMENRTCLKPPTSDLTNKNGLEFLKVASYGAFSTHSFLFFNPHYPLVN